MENNPFLRAAEKLLSNKNTNEQVNSYKDSIIDNNSIVSDFNLDSNDESLRDKSKSKDDQNNENHLSTKYRERINIKNLKNQEKKDLMYNPKYRSHFILNEILNHEEDEETEYKEYFPFHPKEDKRNVSNLHNSNNSLIDNNFYKADNEKRNNDKTLDHFDKEYIIKKTVCSFLNRNGGRIYFGISDNKKVIGIRIPPHEKDQAQLRLFNMISTFWPSANIKHLRVLFYPIRKPQDKFIRDLYIVKMIVKKGDPFKLYSIQKDSFKCFIRSNNQCINLTAENIASEVIERNERMLLLKNVKDSFNNKIINENAITDDVEPDVPKEEEYENPFPFDVYDIRNFENNKRRIGSSIDRFPKFGFIQGEIEEEEKSEKSNIRMPKNFNTDKSLTFNINLMNNGDKLMKISSDEVKPIFKIPRSISNEENLNEEREDFFSLKRKNRNNFLRKNPTLKNENIDKNYRVLVTCNLNENFKEEIVKYLINKSIKYAKADYSQTENENNILGFDHNSIAGKRKFIEIIFDDNESADQAYHELKCLKIKDEKLFVYLL